MTVVNRARAPAWVMASIVAYLVAALSTVISFAYLHWTGVAPFNGLGDVVSSATWGFLAFSMFASGALIVSRVPSNPVGRLLLFAGLTFALSAGLVWVVELFADAGLAKTAGLVEAVSYSLSTLWVPLVVGALVAFPTGTLLSSRWAWLGWLIGVLAVLGVAASMTNGGWAGDLDEVVYVNPLRERLAPLGDVLSSAWQVVSLAVVLGSGTSVVMRFRRSRGVERQQMKWLTFAVTLVVAAIVFTTLTSQSAATDTEWQSVLVGLTMAIVPIGITVAVLKYHLYDIDVVIRRTLTYAGVIGILAIGFAVVVAVPTIVIGSGDGSTSPLLVASATLVAFSLFNPLRRRVQAMIDRRFNRLPYDPEKVRAELAHQLRDTVDADELGAMWISVSATPLQPNTAGVWMRSLE